MLLPQLETYLLVGGGGAQHRAGILAFHPAAQGSILGYYQNIALDVAEIY